MSHKKYRQETNCLNCGAEVKSKFCPECGQENIETHENFFHLVGHFVSDYFHYDSKFFKSVGYLLTRPGFLTKQYWDGKRQQYIHPLRLYFFIVVMGVLLMNFFFQKFDQRIKNRIIQTQFTLDDSTKVSINRDSLNLAIEKYHISKDRVEKDAREREKLGEGIDEFVHQLKYILFFLLPVYALVFKMLYVRRKTFYVDHLVYAMHLQAFAFLSRGIFLLITLLSDKIYDVMSAISYLIIFVYTTMSLRYLYEQSWWKTILKSIIATITILTLLVIVFVVYLLIPLLTSTAGNANINFY